MTDRDIADTPRPGKASEILTVHDAAAKAIKRAFTAAYEDGIIDGAELRRMEHA